MWQGALKVDRKERLSWTIIWIFSMSCPDAGSNDIRNIIMVDKSSQVLPTLEQGGISRVLMDWMNDGTLRG
jgi:hypothetical protein